MNFEANRKKILEELQRQKSRKKVTTSRKPSAVELSGTTSGTPGQKIPVAIFGVKSPFMINLLHLLSSRCETTLMNDVDTTVDFIADHSINHLIIDIDPPSDYHLGVNLLTIVKTVSASVNVYVTTRDINSQQARSLQHHGCALLEKPLSTPVLLSYLT